MDDIIAELLTFSQNDGLKLKRTGQALRFIYAETRQTIQSSIAAPGCMT